MEGSNRVQPAATQVPLQLAAGLALVGIGLGVAFEIGAGAESLSALGVGLGGSFGLFAGIADCVKPLQRAFERGWRLIEGAAVLFLFTATMGYYPLSLLLGLALGMGIGTVCSTVGIAAVRTTRGR